MGLQDYKNPFREYVPKEKSPKYYIIVKDWSHLFAKSNRLEKILNWIKNIGKKRLEKDDTKFESVVSSIEINSVQWEQLCLYGNAINVYNEFDISWSLLIDNFNQLQKFVGTHITKKKIVTDFHKEGYLRHLNYKFINALSSIYIFDKNVEGLAERHLKNETQEKLKKAFSKMYDDSFAYRFCYQLRGYVNHRHLPFEVLHSDLSTDELILNINVENLLNNSYKWNKKVKEEFSKMQHIRLEALIVDIMRTYFANHSTISEIIKEEIAPFVNVVRELGLRHEPSKSYTLRAMWDTSEDIERHKEQLSSLSGNELIDFINEKRLMNLIETNINLAAFEVFESRLGYSLSSDHFRVYFEGLKNKFYPNQ